MLSANDRPGRGTTSNGPGDDLPSTASSAGGCELAEPRTVAEVAAARSAATSSARRVFPTPPAPVIVTSRRFFERVNDRAELGLSTDERAQLDGHVPPCDVQRVQRRELGTKIGMGHLEDVLGPVEAPQPMQAQVPQSQLLSHAVARRSSSVASEITI